MDHYRIRGMSCSACSARVDKAVRKVPGVTDCNVSLLTNSMTVSGRASEKDITEAVRKAGFKASRMKDPAGFSEENGSFSSLRRTFGISLGLLLPLLWITMGHHLFSLPLPGLLQEKLPMGLVQAFLSLCILVLNFRFFRNGARGLFHGAPNMDTLVSLGSGTSWIYSLVLFLLSLFRGTPLPDLYFESSAMILTLITLGKMLEAYSKGRTTDALSALKKLAPENAHVLQNGKELLLPVRELQTGAVLLIRPGEAFPADGTVLRGSSSVNESALTGESFPVDKTVGSAVRAGTLNLQGYLEVRADRVGTETLLSEIIRTVSTASATKAPIARTADRAAGIFVPFVVLISLLTLLIWLLLGKEFSFSLTRAVSVLVVSCPCALGLATPVAVMVGNGVAARHGILFKTAEALEKTGRAAVIVLDKTGTLTNGIPEVTDVITLLPASEAQRSDTDDLLKTASVLERYSQHPIGKAICSYTDKMLNSEILPDLSDFRSETGFGVSGRIGTETAVAGRREYVENFLSVPPLFLASSDCLIREGKTPVFFGLGSRFLGIIAVADGLRKEAPEAVSLLREMGLKTCLLTGDNRRSAENAAAKAGISSVLYDVLPVRKEEEIRKLKRKEAEPANSISVKHKYLPFRKSPGYVIMVGDGINDAPALSAADIGIAIGGGTDIAIDAADVVLLNSRVTDIPAAIRLSRAVNRTIRENLFWAFFYNVLLIPLAAGLFTSFLPFTVSPALSALCMSLSSVFVVTNALRLNRFRPDRSR